MNTSRFLQVAVGEQTTIEPTASLAPGVVIGPHVDIGADVKVEFGSVIGSGVRLAAGVFIGRNVRIDPGVVFASMEHVEPTSVEDGVVVGAGAVLYAGVVIGAKALIRPGSVVTRNVPPGAIVEGNPAVIVGYVDAQLGPTRAVQAAPSQQHVAIEATAVKGVTVHNFPIIPDLRGNLTVGEFNRQIPFIPLRYFMVFGVPNKEVRGEHAHIECHQFLICVRGSCSVMADDGSQRVEILLDAPNHGVHLPPMTWGVQYKYSADALLLVFASHHYAASDYVRDYSMYLKLIGQSAASEDTAHKETP